VIILPVLGKGEKLMFIKSDSDKTDQLELDEQMIDEVANADEFKDKDITAEDVVEALQAIDALADAVLEKADAEQKELNADQLLDEVRDMIDTTHEEEPEEIPAEEELPEELTNAAVRVMVSDEGDIQVEKVPDEIYDDEIDGLDCTVYDTCDMPALEIEDTADEAGDDLLVIGNSKSKSFKKGYMKVASSVSKKAWSAAYKKVRKMVKSGKLTAAHWAIVSAVANKIEERNKFMKKLECALVKKIRSSADYKKRLLKSDMQEAVDDAGVNEKKVEPEEVAGKDNPGYEQENMNKSPEMVDSQSGNPTVDPEKQNEREGDIPVLDDEMITLDVPLANSRRKIALKKVVANHRKGFSAYRVLGANDTIKSALDGKVVKSGKGAFIFKDTANGLLACAAKFVGDGKGTYGTFIKNGKVVIAKAGEAVKLFNNVEKLMNIKAVQSARRSSVGSSRHVVRSSHQRIEASKKSADMKKVVSAHREAALAKIEAKREVRKAQMLASRNEARLMEMHDAEERQRLFQSSQSEINDEKISIKQGMSRNSSTLDKLYGNMF
jgi:hypothetical protein